MAQPFGSLSPDDPLATPAEPAPDLDVLRAMGGKLAQTWPAHLINAIVGGAMAPGDAYSGKMPMAPPGFRREDFTDIPGTAQPNDEAVARSADLSGALAGWGTSVAQKGTLGMAGGRLPPPPPGAAPAVVAPPFYSALEQAVTNAGLNKGVGQQWLGTLKNTPGVKADEIAALGLDRFLGEQRGAVTKQDVLAHIAANKVQVGDVVKGGGGVRTLGDAAIADDVRLLHEHDIYPDTNPADPSVMGFVHPDGDILAAGEFRGDPELGHLHGAAQRITDYFGGGGAVADAARPKFASHVLPGGENYREHLLTLPEKGPNTSGWRAEVDPEGYRSANGGMDYKIFDSSGQVIALRRAGSPEEAIARATKNLSDGASKSVYKSSHWDEPNVLAHMRTNDRLIPNAEGGVDKTLHLEEIQSDWHQQGRRQGYRVEKGITPAEEAELSRLYEISEAEVTPQQLNRIIELDDRESGGATKGVPDAPFKTTWPELALKRAIRHAAENGYDRVSWTPGEAQAARYDLSQHIDKLAYNPESGSLMGWKGNKVPLQQDKVTPEKLADYVGKDVAKKLMEAGSTDGMGYRELHGLDLKVGGEGMKGFYDKMLPSIANKIIKAHGSKVEQVQLPDGPVVHSFKLTPELRKAALEKGFPLFSAGALATGLGAGGEGDSGE